MMRQLYKLPKKNLYFILIPCAVIIFAISMETLLRVKDVAMFQKWSQNNNLQFNQEEAFNAYLTANLSYYFLSIIIPVAYSLHAYFAYVGLRISSLFVFLWFVLVLGGLAYTIVELNVYSIFYYIRVIAYMFLVVSTLLLTSVITESKLL